MACGSGSLTGPTIPTASLSRRSSFRTGCSCILILNAYWEPLEFELPPVGEGGQGSWRRWIDTALRSPQDIVPWQTAPSLSGNSYRATARSVVVLFAEIGRGKALS